jgi:hypothetical protein
VLFRLRAHDAVIEGKAQAVALLSYRGCWRCRHHWAAGVLLVCCWFLLPLLLVAVSAIGARCWLRSSVTGLRVCLARGVDKVLLVRVCFILMQGGCAASFWSLPLPHPLLRSANL